MNCIINRTKLHLYYDNQLSNDETGQMRIHVSKCESCRKEIDYLNKLADNYSEINKHIASEYDDSIFLDLVKSKDKFRIKDVLKDIYLCAVKNPVHRFHISKQMEEIFLQKYPSWINRWVFYC